MTMLPGRSNRTRDVGVSWNVTQPSGPVTASGGVVAVPNGIATTKTSAPCTEWFLLSETWNRAVNVCLEWSGSGLNDNPSMSSRFGSDTSLIEMVVPLGASAFATTAVGTDVDDAAPRTFLAVTRTRSVLPPSDDVSAYVRAVAPPISAQLPPVASQRRHRYEKVCG
jgi:hypothetical protein